MFFGIEYWLKRWGSYSDLAEGLKKGFWEEEAAGTEATTDGMFLWSFMPISDFCP